LHSIPSQLVSKRVEIYSSKLFSFDISLEIAQNPLLLAGCAWIAAVICALSIAGFTGYSIWK